MARLLVIEDEAPLLQSILNTLHFAGFDVVGALDGAAGVELAKTYHPDLVISDIRMPEMDGYGVLQALQANPNTASVPLIFLTAKTERDEMRYGMALGADDYIPKPFTLAELVTAVETRLAKQVRFTELQQQLAEVSKSEQLKSEMLMIAAHDLRSPLTSIRAALYLLTTRFGDEFVASTCRELNSIEAAARRMEAITTNILSLERIQQIAEGDQILTVNLSELVTTVYQEFQEQAQQKTLSFECRISPADIIVPGDPFQLREAVHNLLNNAIKYTPVKGTVTVRLHQTGRKALLLVEDNGPGIPAGEIDLLFQPFHRVPSAEILRTDGTGLGLHLVKNIIERHRGRVFVESVQGQGSVFGFFLPACKPAESLVDETAARDGQRFVLRLISHIKSL